LAEARKEAGAEGGGGEEYGVVAGMLGAFELMDVVADERDVFGLRANVRGDDVYLYPLRHARAPVRRAGSHHESDQGWSKGPIQTQARSALPRFI